MRVYIITSGDYEDYHIDEVFLDRAKAEEWVRRAHKVDYGFVAYEIEDYDVAEDVEGTVPQLNCRAYLPNVESGHLFYRPPDNQEAVTQVWERRAEPVARVHMRGDVYGYEISVEGCDFERVRETFNQKLAEAESALREIALHLAH
jgi:hypothetical protein